MPYALTRERDGVGDSGPVCDIIAYDEECQRSYILEDTHRPQVGCCVRVGSLYARSYSSQDWWLTTPITEILEETESSMRFKTRSNSIYEWREIV